MMDGPFIASVNFRDGTRVSKCFTCFDRAKQFIDESKKEKGFDEARVTKVEVLYNSRTQG